MLTKCSGTVTPRFANNGSLIILKNVKVPSSVHFSPSKGTVLLISLEKIGVCKNKCGLAFFFFPKKTPPNLRAKVAYLFFTCDLTKRALL